MQSEEFDVLLTDLNIGQPGDGFTVVSAMRRTQPNAVTIILTGYPAFETALEAIRSQVDDYIVKPANVETLVGLIERRLLREISTTRINPKHLAQVLQENVESIEDRWLEEMRDFPEFVRLGLLGREPCAYLDGQVRLIASKLDGVDRDEDEARLARDYGEQRSRQRASLELVLEEARAARQSVLGVIQENLLAVNMSHLIHEIIDICEWMDRMDARLENPASRLAELFLYSASAANALGSVETGSKDFKNFCVFSSGRASAEL
jgi:CheY-like chemotaxis protein